MGFMSPDSIPEQGEPSERTGIVQSIMSPVSRELSPLVDALFQEDLSVPKISKKEAGEVSSEAFSRVSQIWRADPPNALCDPSYHNPGILHIGSYTLIPLSSEWVPFSPNNNSTGVEDPGVCQVKDLLTVRSLISFIPLKSQCSLSPSCE